MRVSQLLACAFALSTTNAASLPNNEAVQNFDENSASAPRSDFIASPYSTLEKRKGGGGGRGGGRKGGGGGGGGKGGGGGGSGSRPASGGSAPAGPPRTSLSSNLGGSTKAGSGPPRTFGGGAYYGGGATVPYQSGKKSTRNLSPGLLLGPLLIVAIFPGLWLYSAYPYYYNNSYRFVNETIQNSTYPNGLNASIPVVCLCQEYSVCGCDENTDQQYLGDLVGNGDYNKLNKSLVTVSDVNGTTTLVLNGTLPNGTTAPGGQDDAGVSLSLGYYSGYWVMGLIVLYTAAFM